MLVTDRPDRLAEMLEGLDQLKFINPAGVMSLAEEALSEAIATADPVSQAKALSYWSWAHSLQDDVANGVKHAMAALLLARDSQSTREEARALGMLGAALVMAGLNDEAMVCYQRAEEVATQQGYPDALGLTMNDLGLIALNRNQTEHALVLFERGLRLMPSEAGGGVAPSILHLNLGRTYTQMGSYAEAETCLHRALNIATSHSAPVSMAWALMALGQNAAAQSQFHEADQRFTSAAKLVEKPEQPRLKILILTHHGEMRVACQQFELAAEYFGRALVLARTKHRLRDCAHLLDLMADCHMALGEPAKALACDQEGLKLRAIQNQSDIDTRLSILRGLYTLRHHLNLRFEGVEGRSSLDALLTEERQRIAQQKQHELAEFRDRAAYRIAHELRNPLAIIRSSGELLQQYAPKMDDAKRQQHLDQIMAGTERLTSMITDILNLLDVNALQHPPQPDDETISDD
ncbi:MAG: tetratricopeptide repeat protein [Anaerolineae bacterium]|nr:tetratricopeptide repeat protein [Anaerolineae bacterium]